MFVQSSLKSGLQAAASEKDAGKGAYNDTPNQSHSFLSLSGKDAGKGAYTMARGADEFDKAKSEVNGDEDDENSGDVS
ncbi:Hypothetical predicted protein [Olea europaea subsp. europaea]|uniref:Uncharacterized protein n=1 Tax=Olea europaea subsp. europaea TaxID=158383 RepID=A0A8S0SHL3_OLEEU|nr:Hypothetical predicted protein [Olea europaea subsp. europaea]